MHLALLLSFDKWVFIGAAIGIEVISVTLLIVLRKRKPQIWFPLINALATGLALAGFYVHFGLTPIIWQSSAIFGAAVAAYLIYGAILAIPAFDRHRNLTAVVFLLLTAASIVIGGVLAMDMVFALSAFIWLYLVSYSISYIFPQRKWTAFEISRICFVYSRGVDYFYSIDSGDRRRRCKRICSRRFLAQKEK